MPGGGTEPEPRDQEPGGERRLQQETVFIAGSRGGRAPVGRRQGAAEAKGPNSLNST